MEQKPKAYVKTKYLNYYHNKTKSKLPDKIYPNILSPEYKKYLTAMEYINSRKKQKPKNKNNNKKQKSKTKTQLDIYKQYIQDYKFQLAKYNLNILQKYNPNYKLKLIGSSYYITKEV